MCHTRVSLVNKSFKYALSGPSVVYLRDGVNVDYIWIRVKIEKCAVLTRLVNKP